jgi:uncharacterized membrane protein
VKRGRTTTIQYPVNKTEKEILKCLLEHGTYITTTSLAKKCGVSWNTAIKYLRKFFC